MRSYVEVEFELIGIGLMSWTRMIPKAPARKDHAEWEHENWRAKLHLNEVDEVCIPAKAVKLAIVSAAKHMQTKIPGGGRKQYAGVFDKAILPSSEPYSSTGIGAEDVDQLRLSVPSDGRRGGSTRVTRIFPTWSGWKARFTFLVYDERITKEVFAEHLRAAGLFIGLGNYRPENGGENGRFSVGSLSWTKKTLESLVEASA